MTKASVISPEKGLAVPTMLAGAEGCFMLLSPQLTASRTSRQAGRQAGAGWLWKLDKARLILGKLKYSDGSRV